MNALRSPGVAEFLAAHGSLAVSTLVGVALLAVLVLGLALGDLRRAAGESVSARPVVLLLPAGLCFVSLTLLRFSELTT